MARRRRGGLARQAKQFGNLSVAPERAQAKSDLRTAKRERKLQLRSNTSLAAALQEAIGNASKATSGVPGISQADLATALGELARRHTDVAAGAALARQTIETKAEQARTEGRQKLTELAGRAGTAAAEHLGELQQQKKDRKIEQEKVDISRQGLALDVQKFKLDKYVQNQQLTIDMIKATGEAGKVTAAIKGGFNTALAKLRSSTYTPPGGTSTDKVPITPKYVQQHRTTVVNGIAASTDIKGNKVLAEAVVQRYLGETPSTAVSRYMSRTGIKLFPGYKGSRRGPYVGSRPGIGG
jgi:hypothetical protein